MPDIADIVVVCVVMTLFYCIGTIHGVDYCYRHGCPAAVESTQSSK